MDSNIKLTTKQAEEKMKIYREVFDVVRIIKSTDIRRMQCGQEPELNENMCRCYDFWNKDKQCENCVSEKALTQKKQYTKLECLENDVYQIIAKYLEIDGVPCVMEMIHRLDNENLIDNDGRRILMNNLTGYKNELYRDPLTGVYNRRYYEDNIKDLNENAGVAMIDLDDFKLYNDSYGHNAGDMALETIVSAIKKCIRSSDKIIRLGGDEFLLFMPDADQNSITEVITAIFKKFNTRKEQDPELHAASISAGLYMCNIGDSFEECYAKADKALYFVKQNGKSDFSFYRQIPESECDDHTVENDLSLIAKALRENGNYSGVLDLDYREFAKIYEYMHHLGNRYKYHCYLVMVTMETNPDHIMYIENIEDALDCMEQAIRQKIRKVDVCTHYSSMQYLIILFETDETKIPQIMDRIFIEYYKLYSKHHLEPTYEYIPIMKNKAPNI